jgi:hypothetical protein
MPLFYPQSQGLEPVRCAFPYGKRDIIRPSACLSPRGYANGCGAYKHIAGGPIGHVNITYPANENTA